MSKPENCDPVILFFLNSNAEYAPIPCVEAVPGITYLDLTLYISGSEKSIHEILLVPTTINEGSMDILIGFWKNRIAEENDYDVCDDIADIKTKVGKFPSDAALVTGRHEDIIRQALADYDNGARYPVFYPYHDAAGELIQMGDRLRHINYPVEYDVISHIYRDLAIRISRNGCPDQLIPLSKLENFDAERHILRDWVICQDLQSAIADSSFGR